MMTGVTLGYLYKLRLVYAHFPINTVVADGGKKIEIRNFLGEKITRVVKAYPGAKISLSKDVKEEILVEANDIEMVSLTAARIQQVCDVKKKDIRKFLDGTLACSLAGPLQPLARRPGTLQRSASLRGRLTRGADAWRLSI